MYDPMLLPIDWLVPLGVDIDLAKVRCFVELIRNGHQFEPVEAKYISSRRYQLYDGHHRVAAFRTHR